ncbi:MAG: tetraacyldisaccharide 4'-kinase, partial [Flavobacteriaceae bacterium]
SGRLARDGISILEDRIRPDVILLDDAYQHRSVQPDFSILLTAYTNMYCDDWYLPTGDLRDGRREANRANLIIVTKCPKELTVEEQSLIKVKLKPKTHQEVLFSYMAYDPMVLGSGSEVPLRNLRNRKVTLVTGIADPKPLALFLEKQGISFEHLSFRDHHFFTQKELEVLNSKEFILTTEKDYVRLKGKVTGIHHILVEHRFLDEGGKLIKDTLSGFMKRSS